MSRFGIKTLLYYYIHPKHSNYILINSKTYYHPYSSKYESRTAYTQTHIGMHLYNSRITNGFIEITFYPDSTHTIGCCNSIYYFQTLIHDVIALCIGFWINKNYYSIQEHPNGFLMAPVIAELQPHINSLKPNSVYDLYRQSITWLLPFVIDR